MPRPTQRTLVPLCVVLALIASLPPASFAGALASAAGTIVEALPFVLGAVLLPRVRALRWLPSFGCGCGGALPAALALPGLVLTWLSFGPAVTLARASAGLLLFALRRPSARRRLDENTGSGEPSRDPLSELGTFALAAFSASLVGEVIRANATLVHGPLGYAASFALGGIAGAVAPCATAGIGAALALRAADPWAAFGLLATSGFFPSRAAPRCGEPRDARLPYALLAAGCAILLVRGTHGFLNPRFAFVVPAGALLAAACALRRIRTRGAMRFAAPAMLLGALAFGSPQPRDSVATIPVDLYPGRSLAFTGRIAAEPVGRPTTLVRFAILCCRADAQALSLELDRRLTFARGAWVDVHGTVVAAQRGLVLRVDSARIVAAPSDPYLYL
jgi:hypothetical protein